MQPELKVRVNGAVVEELRVLNKIVNGAPTVEKEIAVAVNGLGWFTVDDNNLWDQALPRFVLEYDLDKGWTSVTVKELLVILQATGVIL